jgi:enamine deaminase RidA (YjgF/YER057c/UK114 family)
VQLTLDNPATVPAPVGPYAHVARLEIGGGGGALLVLSGQIAVDDSGNVVAGDITVQSERVFALIRTILAAHGATFADILHIRTFLTNLDDLPGYGAVRRRLFPENPPASTTVEVSRLFRPEALLEVEVTAAVATGD